MPICSDSSDDEVDNEVESVLSGDFINDGSYTQITSASQDFSTSNVYHRVNR